MIDPNGKSVVTGGVGLITQPAQFSVYVPVADPGEIVSATFYWNVRVLSGGATTPSSSTARSSPVT